MTFATNIIADHGHGLAVARAEALIDVEEFGGDLLAKFGSVGGARFMGKDFYSLKLVKTRENFFHVTTYTQLPCRARSESRKLLGTNWK